MNVSAHPKMSNATELRSSASSHLHCRSESRPLMTALPKGLLLLGIAGYAALVGVFWMAFGGDAGAAFVLVVVSLFGLMYLGLPYLMNRTAANHGVSQGRLPAFSEFLNGDFDTLTGRISGWAAFMQSAFLPIALAFGALAIGIIMMSLRQTLL